MMGNAPNKKPHVCYRCGGPATTNYMSLQYCVICKQVVKRMAHLIPMGPPFGFPGADGYDDDDLVSEPQVNAPEGGGQNGPEAAK
jgi:hypothetical protein